MRTILAASCTGVLLLLAPFGLAATCDEAAMYREIMSGRYQTPEQIQALYRELCPPEAYIPHDDNVLSDGLEDNRVLELFQQQLENPAVSYVELVRYTNHPELERARGYQQGDGRRLRIEGQRQRAGEELLRDFKAADLDYFCKDWAYDPAARKFPCTEEGIRRFVEAEPDEVFELMAHAGGGADDYVSLGLGGHVDDPTEPGFCHEIGVNRRYLKMYRVPKHLVVKSRNRYDEHELEFVFRGQEPREYLVRIVDRAEDTTVLDSIPDEPFDPSRYCTYDPELGAREASAKGF
ncbi:MAG: hypothetical protein A2284_01645 [Deltaproteobacteria bacterium RIFOXYA12_FULL_61_11]|nr:MAG: hypothetical protein A2284_01645 [Deltaproteobacteria bacterium RIFOXYA12_FULL_61_11]